MNHACSEWESLKSKNNGEGGKKREERNIKAGEDGTGKGKVCLFPSKVGKGRLRGKNTTQICALVTGKRAIGGGGEAMDGLKKISQRGKGETTASRPLANRLSDCGSNIMGH